MKLLGFMKNGKGTVHETGELSAASGSISPRMSACSSLGSLPTMAAATGGDSSSITSAAC